MSIRTRTCLGVAAGVATLLVAGTALAGKPMTAAEKKAKAEVVANNSRNLPQPRTMAEAEATEVRTADGGVMVMVPTELWNHLAVSRDAEGKLKIVESEGKPLPGAARQEASHD